MSVRTLFRCRWCRPTECAPARAVSTPWRSPPQPGSARRLSSLAFGLRAARFKLRRPSWVPRRRTTRRTWRTPQKNQTTLVGMEAAHVAHSNDPHGDAEWRTRRKYVLPLGDMRSASVGRCCRSHMCEASHDVGMLMSRMRHIELE